MLSRVAKLVAFVDDLNSDLFVSLLEAQAATGRILDPTTGGRHSVEDALKEGLIDKQAETVLNRWECSHLLDRRMFATLSFKSGTRYLRIRYKLKSG